MRSLRQQRVRALVALVVTLLLLYWIPNQPLVLVPLFVCWFLVFRPLTAGELAVFIVAASFMLVQNYLALRAGTFEFRDKDILLMPYWEPFLWGFYFLGLKRFVGDRDAAHLRIDARSFAGLAATSAAFAFFSFESDTLLLATLCSTAFLFLLFHTGPDCRYALTALALGVIVELFGVWTGLWWYPAPDVLGIPYWFATMWLSVGLLGRRFAIPAAERLAALAVGRGQPS